MSPWKPQASAMAGELDELIESFTPIRTTQKRIFPLPVRPPETARSISVTRLQAVPGLGLR